MTEPRLRDLELRVDDLGAQVRDCIRTGDCQRTLPLLVERAELERELRELYGPWSPKGDRYGALMRIDLRRARELDWYSFDRELVQYPRLQRELVW